MTGCYVRDPLDVYGRALTEDNLCRILTAQNRPEPRDSGPSAIQGAVVEPHQKWPESAYRHRK